MSADYTCAWQEVFLRATKYIIQGSQSLDILASAGSASGTEDLPSWVPNFAQQSIDDYSSEVPNIPDPTTITNMTRFRAGGPQVSNLGFFNNDRFFRLEAIVVGPILHTLPRKHFGRTLGPIEELARRMNYLSADYVNAVTRPSNNLLRCLAGFVAKMLYCATYELPDRPAPHHLDEQWPPMEFVKTCIDAVTQSQGLSISPARLSRLETEFSKPRSIFMVNLPPPFSLLDDLLSSLTNTHGLTAHDRHMISSIPSFQVPGYCRVQEGWGQGDYVAVIPGCKVPLRLRPINANDCSVMRVISEAYVYGIMDGEALERLPRQRIVLV
jgi:hypothetical protein